MKNILPLFLLIIGHFHVFGQSSAGNFAEEIAQHRKTYKKGFLENERSPLDSADLPSLRFFEPDEHYRAACTFRRTPDEQPFDLPTYSGITRPYVKYGILSFEIEGRKLQLAVYQNLTMRNMPQYAQHLFLPFRDATNDETTYGGGRYIDLTISDVEGEAPMLDFNKCYNPWCHYSDGFNCPIPPTENHLDISIEAGEKMWVGEKKH
jgi:uncharacterized protein (DUF1684 family)